jgi:hypothetical protein
VAEPNRATSIFTGGGSKDPQDISNWAWKDAGGLPDKDNLQHSFAARYSETPSATCPAGTAATCDLLFFGSDRFDNSGDAQQGFWFFQNPVTLGNVSSGGGFNFNGVHKNGDVLIISDFSNGGTTSTISVYAWDDSVSGNLRLLASSTDAKCSSATAGDAFCGIVNPTNGTVAPWAFTDKSGNHTYLNGEFYEGGINLSTLGLSGECFSSVASETRSSTSTTATLKDFVLGGFGRCVATLSTQVSNAGPVVPGASVHDTLTVASSDTTHTATGNVEWFLCGPIATGACDTGGTQLTSSTVTSTLSGSGGTATANSPNVNTVAVPLGVGRYCFRAEWPGDTNFKDGPYSEFGGATGTNECFTVKDTSSITTAQSWLPQDTATVTTAGGTTVSGTVVFSLYTNGTCSGTAARTFTDTAAPFETNNSTYLTSSTIISWSATFTPTDANAVVGSTTTRCEKSDLTINNSASDFPPAP